MRLFPNVRLRRNKILAEAELGELRERLSREMASATVQGQNDQEIAVRKALHEKTASECRAHSLDIMRRHRLCIELAHLEFLAATASRLDEFTDHLRTLDLSGAARSCLTEAADGLFGQVFDDTSRLTEENLRATES